MSIILIEMALFQCPLIRVLLGNIWVPFRYASQLRIRKTANRPFEFWHDIAHQLGLGFRK